MRYALGIQYDGALYHGWQKQLDLPHLKTIQAELEQAISRIADHAVLVTVAGRTDKGVHASYQVVHFDTDAIRLDHAWIFGINRFLSNNIRVFWIRKVPQDFHARYSACTRTYQYWISQSRVLSPWWISKITHLRSLNQNRLDLNKIKQATRYWIGEHDFSSFRAKDCQSKSPTRTILDINIQATPNQDLIKIEFTANAFLYHMIRNMVGVLLKIGSPIHAVSPEWAKTVLLARDRKAADMTAPSDGLYLTHVDYGKRGVELDFPEKNDMMGDSYLLDLN